MTSLQPDVVDPGVTFFDPLLERATACIQAGIHVHLVGPHFSGRSALLSKIGARLNESGRNILRVDGNPAWREESLGALVAAGMAPEPNPRMLGDIVSSLDKMVYQRQPVILSDDTINLDRRSAGVLLTVLRKSGTPTVTVDLSNAPRHANPLGSGLTPAISLHLGTLDLNQLQELANAVLGAPLGPVSVTKLSIESGGRYGLARALLVIGREVGTIKLEPDGIYRIPGELWSPDLLWLAERLVADVDDDLMNAAAKLASAGPSPVEDAVRLLGTDTLDALLAASLAHRTEFNNGATIGIYPGLLVNYLHCTREMAWPSAGWADGSDMRVDLTTDLQNLDTGLIAQQLVSEANERAQALRAEWDADPTPRHGLPLLIALLDSAATDEEIENVIRGTQLTGAAPEPALFLARAARWLASRDREAEAYALLHCYRENNPSSDAILRVAEAQSRFNRNERPPAKLLAPVGPADHPFGAEMLTDMQIQLAISAGKTRTALDMLANFTPTFAYLSERKPVWQLLADVFSGNIVRSVSVALGHLRSSKRLLTADATEVYGYTALVALYASGRCHEAHLVLQNILATSLATAFHSSFHAGTLTLGALIAAREGNAATARSLSSRAGASSRVPGPFPGMTAAAVRALIEAGSDRATTASALWKLVAGRLDRGYVLSAFTIAVDAVEFGPDTHDVIPRLQHLMREVESPLLETMGRYIFAAADEDVDELEETRAEFADTGAMLFATKATITLAIAYRHRGELQRTCELADSAWKHAAETGHEGPSVFTRIREEVGLSDREREVLNYVADGMSHADIAALLDLSARTVETHLLNATRKVGAPNRAALLQAIQTWLAPPSV